MSLGSMGISAQSPVPSDLEGIYQGGQFFLDRMKAMGAVRDEAQAALDALKLGQDIDAAKKQAEAARALAGKDRSDAAKELADAKAKAADIIATANAKVDDLVNAANNSAAGIRATAEAAQKKADDAIAKSKAAADAALKDAQEKQAQISGQLDAAKKAEADFIAAKADQEAATKAANGVQKLYQSKIKQIQTVIGS